MGKHRFFPTSQPLAYLRSGPVDAERVDDVAEKLRHRRDNTSRDALQLINDLAAYVISMENELGRAYEEGNKNAA